MARANSLDRMERLDQLTVLLKQDGLWTVQTLAQHFGVSARTITRDLAILRDQGVPIDADRGRGGGVRLTWQWGVGRLNLSYAQSVDLLISIAVAEQLQSPIFMANLSAIRRQIIASFGSEKRRKVERLKSRILIGATASIPVQQSVQTYPAKPIQIVHQSFVDQNAVEIKYRNESGKISKRVIEPHYLLFNYPVWYIFGHDHLRDDMRTFRMDRILGAQGLADNFSLRAMSEIAPRLEAIGLLK